MTTIFASDFHGTGDVYINKIQKMCVKYPSAQVVFGGDYIDGRKNSKQVLNYIHQMQLNHHAIALKGNHEDLMLSFVHSGTRWDYDGWRENGGNTTYRSLVGKRIRISVAQKELENVELYDGTNMIKWMNQLPLTYINDDACFVHAELTLDQAPHIEQTIVDESKYPPHHAKTLIKSNQYLVYPVQEAVANSKEETKLWGRDFVQMAGLLHNYSDHAIVIGHTPTYYFTPAGQTAGMCAIKYQDENTFKQHVMCPIIEYHYDGEQSIIACDGGCHSGENYNTGNVVVIDHGKIIDWMN